MLVAVPENQKENSYLSLDEVKIDQIKTQPRAPSRLWTVSKYAGALLLFTGAALFAGGSCPGFASGGLHANADVLTDLTETDTLQQDSTHHKTYTTSESSKSLKPHIVMVVFDDVGHADTTVYRPASEVGWSTPNIERLSTKEGVLLTNYYTQAVCSPTRSALMTSRFPFRTGMQHRITVMPGTAAALPLDAPTLPELLGRESGYVSHMVGKWHLGMASVKNTPTGRGFSSYLGIMQGMTDYRTMKFVNGFDFWEVDAKRDPASTHYKHAATQYIGNHTELIYRDRLRNVIEQYVKEHPSGSEAREREPLFVYMAHQSVHIPIQPYQPEPERCKSASKVRYEYCAMAVQLDDSFGLLEQTLKNSNIWDETLILVTTDNSGMVPFSRRPRDAPDAPPNSGASVGSNYPLRGSKATLFEGGVRSLGFITGGWLHPEVRGKPYDGLAHAVDLPALALRAASLSDRRLLSSLASRHRLDGNAHESIAFRHDAVLNSADVDAFAATAHKGRDDVPFNIIEGGKDYSGIRFGRWKLLVGDPSGGNKDMDGWFPLNATGLPIPAPPRSKSQNIQLYDLEADPTETNDLSRQRPEIVRNGLARIQDYVDSGDYREPQSLKPYVIGRFELHNGAWAPFLKNPADLMQEEEAELEWTKLETASDNDDFDY